MDEGIEDLLKKGTLTCIMNNGIMEDPVLQVLDIQKFSLPGRLDRYILNLSDSLNFYPYVVLATNLNHWISDGLAKYCIIQLKNYVINLIIDPVTKMKKKVLVILDLVVLILGENVEQYGNPTTVYVHDLFAGISKSILTSQTFEVHELLKGLGTR